MRETRTSGSMSGVRRRSDGAERGTDEIAKAFGNSYSPSLWQPRLTPTLPPLPQNTHLSWKTIVYTLRRCGSNGIARKAAANARTHGVSFAEAVTVLEEDLPSPVQILTPSRKNAS